jgi:hypothetical protein
MTPAENTFSGGLPSSIAKIHSWNYSRQYRTADCNYVTQFRRKNESLDDFPSDIAGELEKDLQPAV